jgi:hypothetical protein
MKNKTDELLDMERDRGSMVNKNAIWIGPLNIKRATKENWSEV